MSLVGGSLVGGWWVVCGGVWWERDGVRSLSRASEQVFVRSLTHQAVCVALAATAPPSRPSSLPPSPPSPPKTGNLPPQFLNFQNCAQFSSASASWPPSPTCFTAPVSPSNTLLAFTASSPVLTCGALVSFLCWHDDCKGVVIVRHLFN